MLLVAPAFGTRAFAAAGGGIMMRSEISGVVRNAQGIAQMGALVQVLGEGAHTVGTAFTDQHGRYLLTNLSAGRYIVRASATLYVPTTRANLELRQGTSAVVDLTLAALFDPTSWLPAQRRRPEEPGDDWKWTLRSTANRPILRVVAEDDASGVSSSAEHAPHAAALRASETVSSGDGGFGEGGVHNVIQVHRMSGYGVSTAVRADIGTRDPSTPFSTPGRGNPTQFNAGFEQRSTFGGAMRSVVTYQSHPELVTSDLADPQGVQVITITTAERFAVGDRIEVDAGGQLEGVRSAVYAFATHPFLRVAAHPTGTWTLQYRMATDRGTQGFEDTTVSGDDVPVALIRNGHLALESGRHQEISAARKTARASVAIAFYHDFIGTTAVAGGGASIAEPGTGGSGGDATNTMVVDPTTGSFRALTSGYTTNGARVTVSAPLAEGLWIAAEYSTGEALLSTTGPEASYAEALSGLAGHQSQAAMIALQGKLVATGTKVRASYRSQPSRAVTAVDPYSDFASDAFFNFMLEQPVRLGSRFPKGMNATIDVTNLLAQGYRPFLSADGQTLYFAQAPRTIQAGLSFNF
jgi:hypothetical protein